MPPNRKGTFDQVDTATLNVAQFVTEAKYQPLTAPVPQDPTVPSEEAQSADTAIGNGPLLPKDANRTILDRILQEERIREQFSADHAVEKEVRHAAETKDNDRIVQRNNANYTSVSQNYWDMDAGKDLVNGDQVVKADNDVVDHSYWEWPTESKEAANQKQIRNILEEEKTRQLFSIEHVEKPLQADASRLQPSTTVNANHDEYWMDADNVVGDDTPLSAEQKAAVIIKILAEEKLRQQFSVASLEEKLVKDSKMTVDSGTTSTSNDDYWMGF